MFLPSVGSPFTVEIVDSSRVTVSGDGISLVPVNRSTSFTVDTQGSSSGHVDVEIVGELIFKLFYCSLTHSHRWKQKHTSFIAF